MQKTNLTNQLASPHFLLIATLLFWGWQTKLLLFAIPMCLILEVSRWIRWRWHFEDKEVNRITDFTSILSLVIIVYLFSQQSVHGLFTLVKWLPILFFSIIVTQVYGTHTSLKLSSLFISLRKSHGTQQRIDIRFSYIVMCLLSASVNNADWFFLGVCLLVSWALWSIRPKCYSIFLWSPLLVIALSLATAGQIGLHELQKYLEGALLNWFETMIWDMRDPYRQNTAIGDIGHLKLSDRIVLRVKSPYPILLREASYDTYFKETWRSKQAGFEDAKASDDYTYWSFTDVPQTGESKSVKISRYLKHGKGMLALPNGTYQLTDLIAQEVERNDFGAVKVELGPDLIEYTAHFNQNNALDKNPAEQDLYIPDDEREYLEQLLNSLNLHNQSLAQKAQTIIDFFNQDFKYSLQLTAQENTDLSPLAYFLYSSKKGHCEYFATATTLLLRTAGIPARYAVGFAAEEYSPLEKQYVVRRRHAHAWSLAYLNGRWQNIDTTPAIWADLEEEASPWWTSIYDVFAWANFNFSKWQWRESEGVNPQLLWLILPLSLILIWRLYLRKRVDHFKQKREQAKNQAIVMGTDSPFYAIIEKIGEEGYIRLSGETVPAWFQRIRLFQVSDDKIKNLIALHQRYRFDPHGISAEAKSQLKTEVQKWLKKHKK